MDLIRKIQSICKETDDDLRWLVALISDTGMRLGEVTGLLKSDIILDKELPYINLQPHSWRRLKTKASERQIPLVGMSLWAAKKIKNYQHENPFAFPRYCNEFGCNANSASAALNKWMKESTGSGYVLHSFRHSMRDRLRNIECPSEIIDQIGGWTRESIGEGYGVGHSLELKFKWIKKIL
jgi:integrase